jgi:hypothetical protein
VKIAIGSGKANSRWLFFVAGEGWHFDASAAKNRYDIQTSRNEIRQ